MQEIMQIPPVRNIDAYMVDSISGTMAAGLSANALVYSVRWAVTTHIALIRQVRISMLSLGTAFTAGLGEFRLYVARSFTASDTGGNSVLPINNYQKLRTCMSIPRFTAMSHASTGALTAGTRTLDTNPLRRIIYNVGTDANTVYLPTTVLFGAIVDADFPLVLEANEGFVITATVPATGTWQFAVGLEWMEVPR